jgi:hypothetical protein
MQGGIAATSEVAYDNTIACTQTNLASANQIVSHPVPNSLPLPAEDDMEISPDFFDYFEAFLPLLHSDKSLLCISSWNDNGKHFQVSAPDVFYRTDFFPGWSMTRKSGT